MSNHKLNLSLEKAINLEALTKDEIIDLYNKASLSSLLFYSDCLRKIIHPNNVVSYIIDRNINLTNICFSNCLFCNFCRKSTDEDAYILKLEDYEKKINELFSFGGKQILLQGGMNPNLRLDYYVSLFKDLKNKFPDLKLHALGPPEIVFLSEKSGNAISETLKILKDAGLDSLPGAGAEILSDRVRKIISPAKCSTQQWLDVMSEAHRLGITSSATMMFGHLETIEERVEHLLLLRKLQTQKPSTSKGFISFTLWPLASKNTRIIKKFPEIKPVMPSEFLRMLAISRLVLNNIPNVQASWLTMGKDIAQLCLHCGANDLSSVMIEENVVSQAGKNHKVSIDEMQQLIIDAGFIPKRRNQEYEYL